MNNLIENIKRRFNLATIAVQMIYINVAIFLFTYLFKAVASLMLWNQNWLFDWFALSIDFEQFFTSPWSLITYAFLHGGFLHILFNMIVLFYFGNLFLDFFSKKQFFNYYFIGIIVGGLVFMVSYNYFPALRDKSTYLVGASAGVTAILVGLATKIPNYAMRFRFIGPVKLWYIAVGFIVLDIIQIPMSNTGGHLAHLGGALVGFLLTSQFQGGKKSATAASKVFRSKKQNPLKTVYKKSRSTSTSETDVGKQQKIDSILDKISKSGYETLTKEEKEFLFSVGKKE